CPSNPFISIDPILAIPGVRAALRDCKVPVVAVSPIIGGKAVKGPTAKMMAELGLPVDAAAVAHHYRDLLDVYIADEEDAAALAPAVPTALRQALMLAMLEDVLAALADASGLAGRLLVTTDPAAQRLASRYRADWLTDGASDGHTGAVAAAARHLAANGAAGM